MSKKYEISIVEIGEDGNRKPYLDNDGAPHKVVCDGFYVFGRQNGSESVRAHDGMTYRDLVVMVHNDPSIREALEKFQLLRSFGCSEEELLNRGENIATE